MDGILLCFFRFFLPNTDGTEEWELMDAVETADGRLLVDGVAIDDGGLRGVENADGRLLICEVETAAGQLQGVDTAEGRLLVGGVDAAAGRL